MEQFELNNMIDWTQSDKREHYKWGYWIAQYSFIPVINLLLAVLVGALKELIHDGLLGLGKCEWNDFAATVTGGFDAFLYRKRKTTW